MRATNWLTRPWGEASLVVILYWFWLFVFIVDIFLVFLLAQHHGRTSPRIVAHTCKSTSGKLSQGDSEFEASLGSTVRPGLKNNSLHQVHAEYTFSPFVSASNRAQVICTKQVNEVMANQGLVRIPGTEGLASQRVFLRNRMS